MDMSLKGIIISTKEFSFFKTGEDSEFADETWKAVKKHIGEDVRVVVVKPKDKNAFIVIEATH